MARAGRAPRCLSDGDAAASYGDGYNDVVAYGNDTFVAGGGLDNTTFSGGVFYTSSDGLRWAAHSLPDGYAATGIQFVNGVFFAPVIQYGASDNTGYLVSTDGVNWKFDSVDPQEGDLSAATLLYTGSQYVIAGEAGVWTSHDLHAWTPVFAGPRTFEARCLGHGNKIGYLMVGANQVQVLKSANGTDWPDKPTAISARIGYTHTLQYSDGCIAAGPAGYVSQNTYSADGVNWHDATVPKHDDIWLVAHNSAGYLAVAKNSNDRAFDILVNSDGATWTYFSDAPSSSGRSVAPRALQTINDSFFLTTYVSGVGFAIMHSPDGTAWTDVTPPIDAQDSQSVPHIGYGNGILIAMWNDKDGKLKIAQSKDEGANWTVVADAFSNGLTFQPTSITYGGGTYMAVGHAPDHRHAYPATGAGEFLVSTDGTHWTYAIDNRTGPLNTLFWDGDKFVTNSVTDVMISSGGLPAVALKLSADAPASIQTGKPFSIKLTIDNVGNVQADEVALEDNLPTAAKLDSVSAKQGKCTHDDDKVSCALGTFPIGAQVIVTLNFTAASATGTARNKASLHARQKPSTDAKTRSTSTVIVQKSESKDKPPVSGSSGGGGGALGLFSLSGLLSQALRRRRRTKGI